MLVLLTDPKTKRRTILKTITKTISKTIRLNNFGKCAGTAASQLAETKVCCSVESCRHSRRSSQKDGVAVWLSKSSTTKQVSRKMSRRPSCKRMTGSPCRMRHRRRTTKVPTNAGTSRSTSRPACQGTLQLQRMFLPGPLCNTSSSSTVERTLGWLKLGATVSQQHSVTWEVQQFLVCKNSQKKPAYGNLLYASCYEGSSTKLRRSACVSGDIVVVYASPSKTKLGHFFVMAFLFPSSQPQAKTAPLAEFFIFVLSKNLVLMSKIS